MDKIVRRTVTITITETWTIIWTDAPEMMAANDDAEQGQSVTRVVLPELSPPATTHAEIVGPSGEPAALPGGQPMLDPPHGCEKQATLNRAGIVIKPARPRRRGKRADTRTAKLNLTDQRDDAIPPEARA